MALPFALFARLAVAFQVFLTAVRKPALAVACAVLTIGFVAAFYAPPRAAPGQALGDAVDILRERVHAIDPHTPFRVRELLAPLAALAAGWFAAAVPGRRNGFGRVFVATLGAGLVVGGLVSLSFSASESETLNTSEFTLDVSRPIARFELTSSDPIRGVSLVSMAMHAADLESGQTIVKLTSEGDAESAIPIRVGFETAEWSLARPDVRRRARHRGITIASTFPRLVPPHPPFLGRKYVATLRFARPVRASALRLELVTGSEVAPVSLVVSELRALRW